MARLIHLGFRFTPTPREAITYHLPRLIADEPVHPAVRPFIHDADVYACEPGVLAARFRATSSKARGERFFFFTTRKSSSEAVRAAGPGSWHCARGNATDVEDGAGVKVGEVRRLRYKKGGAFTDWLMDEYSCFLEPDAVGGDSQRVLCKIYVSPRAGPDSAARQESSAAVFAPPAPEDPIAARTRPAQPIAEQARRAVMSITPEVMQAPMPCRHTPQSSLHGGAGSLIAGCST